MRKSAPPAAADPLDGSPARTFETCFDRPIGGAQACDLIRRSVGPGPARVLLAVSGGPDSLALLVLVGENRERLGLEFAVATVDHGLRPEAAEEARAVAGVAGRYGLSHRTLVWTRAGSSGNLPAAAREARYRLLAQAARDCGAAAVMTAHHQDDQIETHLMAAERGEGARRLAGMRAWRDLEPGLVLLRPFLGMPKTRLVASLRARCIPYADDPTNSDPRYARARWREHLSTLDIESRSQLLSAIERAGAERDALDADVRRALEQVRVGASGLVTAPRSVFGATAPAAPALLSRILSAAGGAANPASGTSVSRLLARLAGAEPFLIATLGGCRVMAEPERVRVAREYGRIGPAPLDPAFGTCFDGRFDIDPIEPRSGRIVPLGSLGRGGPFDATLPVSLDSRGRPVSAHPAALRRFPAGTRALGSSERVSWRLRRDLPAAGGISQIAAKEPPQVGKDFPADYLHLRRMERTEVDAQARPVAAQSQDER